MMSETLNFNIMIYVDLVQTFSSETLWFEYKKHFWAGAVPTIERMKYEEFERALDYFRQCQVEPVIDWTCLNDFFWMTEDEEWKEIIGRKLWED